MKNVPVTPIRQPGDAIEATVVFNRAQELAKRNLAFATDNEVRWCARIVHVRVGVQAGIVPAGDDPGCRIQPSDQGDDFFGGMALERHHR